MHGRAHKHSTPPGDSKETPRPKLGPHPLNAGTGRGHKTALHERIQQQEDSETLIHRGRNGGHTRSMQVQAQDVGDDGDEHEVQQRDLLLRRRLGRFAYLCGRRVLLVPQLRERQLLPQQPVF